MLLAPNEFIAQLFSGHPLLLDARSPKEYLLAHVPGAVNLPLLEDDERRQIGLVYKSNGREAAVQKGFDLVGPKFGDFLRKTKSLTAGKHVMLYCWRGGLRSSIMSWVLSTGGFKVDLLKGGYKAFRKFVFDILDTPKKIIVLGGKTGIGKTEVLDCLKASGQQVICLETLASHKGSAFGALGMKPQPRNEMFQNLLALEWMKMDPEKNLWLENESRLIGPILLPEKIYELMRHAPLIEIVMDDQERVRRIVNEYGRFPMDELAANTEKLAKRLGGQRTQQALDALQQGDLPRWVEEVLHYYDKTYQYGIDSRVGEVFQMNVKNESSRAIAARLSEIESELRVKINHAR